MKRRASPAAGAGKASEKGGKASGGGAGTGRGKRKQVKVKGKYTTDTPFRRRVWAVLKTHVPAGKITTYKAIADSIGCGSMQAIGQALKHNPYAPVVPCHRVVASSFALGGFSGATDPSTPEIKRKVALLKSEGVSFTSDDRKVKNPPAVFLAPPKIPKPETLESIPLLTTGAEVRLVCRKREWRSHTSGLAAGYAQANLVILPSSHAADFKRFCESNPKPCPLLEMTDAGSPLTKILADGADLRTDLPKYDIYRDGVLAESVFNLTDLWADDLVGFLLGCSFSFEEALMEAGLPVRHLEEINPKTRKPKNVPMYRTTVATMPAGPFNGPLVVSMRPMTPEQAKRAVTITKAFPRVHGDPVHIGHPSTLGIKDINRPQWGDAVTIRDGEVPVFWACGVTPSQALVNAKLPFAITHSPGHMFVADLKNAELRTES